MRKQFLALAVVFPGLLLVPLAASAANSPAQIINCAGTPPWCFSPNPIQITARSTVTWTNAGQVVHTVTDDPAKAINKPDAVLPSGAQPWDSGNVAGGATYSRTFDIPGQYTYFCIPHEALGMVGHLTVSG